MLFFCSFVPTKEPKALAKLVKLKIFTHSLKLKKLSFLAFVCKNFLHA